LYAPTAAFVAALADEGTPVYVDHVLARDTAAVDWIRFHTDAPIADVPGAAAFAIVVDPAAMPPLKSFAMGSAEYPDRSTTVVIQVETVSRETGLRLEGPGIKGFAELAADPLPAEFVHQLIENHALYPRGVDVVLVSPTAVAALPRSVRVQDSGSI